MQITSKPIQKTDDSAKQLIIEALEGQVTGGFDLDSVYYIEGKYYVLEFLKCDTVRPYDSHPSRYWRINKQKFLSLWKITKKLDGYLFLVNYEDSREQFKIIKVIDLNADGIQIEEVYLWNFTQFKDWFKALNNHSTESVIDIPQRIIPLYYSVREDEQYSKYLPFYEVKVACGAFIEGGIPEELGWIDVEAEGIRANNKRFIVKASGDSMLPKIKSGDLCVFERNWAGSRNGQIVLAQSRDFDPDYTGKYTIKKYQSVTNQTSEWDIQKSVDLIPLNQDYEVIHLSEDDDVQIIGVLIGTIQGGKFKELEEPEEPHIGYCIRCGKAIDYSFHNEKPILYCKECWRAWLSNGANPDSSERYCHRCGKSAKPKYKDAISYNYPICAYCWKDR